MKPSVCVYAMLAAVSLAACGGDGPTDPGGDPGGGNGNTRTIKDDPSFANDVWEIFTRRGCAAGSCHGGGEGNLTMASASGAYTSLVGVTSLTSGEVLVIPSNANDSYLVKKLEGRQGSGNGARMPLGGSALDNIDLSNIKNWINQGAKNN